MESSDQDTCSALAFYGLSAGTQGLSDFYLFMASIFEFLGHPADKLSVHGPGHAGKPISFVRADSKLRQTGFSEVSSLFLCAMATGGTIPVHDYLLASSCSLHDNSATFVARSPEVSLSREALLEVATGVIGALHPEYGIGYSRPHALGPLMYALGIAEGLGATGADFEEALAISRWSDAQSRRIWRDGIMRDVYPQNYLTAAQLSVKIEGLPLERWISLDSGRGSLISLGHGVTLWEVPGPSINAVRKSLSAAGALLDWTRQLS